MYAPCLWRTIARRVSRSHRQHISQVAKVPPITDNPTERGQLALTPLSAFEYHDDPPAVLELGGEDLECPVAAPVDVGVGQGGVDVGQAGGDVSWVGDEAVG